jgi:mRNA-degrading endonuclease toxin of MazEF toxin-antitoxin module
MNNRWGVFSLNPEAVSIVVVSSEIFNTDMHVVTVVPLVPRKEGRRIYPNEALIKASGSGLPSESIALVHQITTIPKKRLSEQLGTVDNRGERKAVFDALSNHLEMYWD